MWYLALRRHVSCHRGGGGKKKRDGRGKKKKKEGVCAASIFQPQKGEGDTKRNAFSLNEGGEKREREGGEEEMLLCGFACLQPCHVRIIPFEKRREKEPMCPLLPHHYSRKRKRRRKTGEGDEKYLSTNTTRISLTIYIFFITGKGGGGGGKKRGKRGGTRRGGGGRAGNIGEYDGSFTTSPSLSCAEGRRRGNRGREKQKLRGPTAFDHIVLSRGGFPECAVRQLLGD